MKLAAILLAAGRSERFTDGDKLTTPIAGRPMIAHCADALALSEISQLIAVVRPECGINHDTLGSSRWQIVVNTTPNSQLSDSLRVGLENIAQGTAGAIVALADTPGLTQHDTRLLYQAFLQSEGCKIVMPATADDRPAHPVLWPSHFFSQLSALHGDMGGRNVIKAEMPNILRVNIDNPDIARDIDTVSDLQAWRRSRPRQEGSV